MNRSAQSILVLLLGGALLRITVGTDVYLRYVKAGLRWPLILAGLVLVVAGAVTLVREALGKEPESDDDGHGHHHHGGPRAAWLLLLPVFAILLVAPPSLGAYSATRSGAAAVRKPSADYPALAAGDPVRISLIDYVSRAVWDGGTSLQGRNLRLTGFVTTDHGGRVYLTRLVMFCCAADAQAVRIRLSERALPALGDNTWITVVGRYDKARTTDPVSGAPIPTLDVTGLRRVAAPAQPYDV